MTMTASVGNRVLAGRPDVKIEDVRKGFMEADFFKRKTELPDQLTGFTEVLVRPTITVEEFNAILNFVCGIPFKFRGMPYAQGILFLATEKACVTIKQDRGVLSKRERTWLYGNINDAMKHLNNPEWTNYLKDVLTTPTEAV